MIDRLCRIHLLCVAVCWSTFAGVCFGQHIAPTDALTPQQQRKKFHLPPGFAIQLVASEPAIGQPMNLNFDAAGRLWVTSSFEYPFPARGEGVQKRNPRFPGVGDHPPRDRLTVFAGIGRDGRARTRTDFATGLNIPIGNVPIPHGALVYSIPGIYRCLDTDGDGKADTRTMLYGRFGNLDTHGMSNSYTRWIDGWIYGCHGFSNTSRIRDASGRVTVMRSGNTYRFKQDGSRFEQFTWGQTNPFGLTFDPLGNLFSADCHSKPLYQLLRGASYPGIAASHRDDGLPFGPTMISHNHGSTGICGPAYYAAEQFPPGYRNGLFLCNPVTGRVHHDRVKVVGSTILADTQPDFIRCDDPWFRPVDAQVGPDGALYIADFYNAIIGHYEVPLKHPKRDRTHGRIWRVIYTGTKDKPVPPPRMPDLTKLSLKQLVAKLADANLVVRTLATNEIVDRHARAWFPLTEVWDALHDSRSPEQRAHCLWVLERLHVLDAKTVRRLAADPHRLVRVHLMKALAERKSWDDETDALVLKAINDRDAFVQRAAADALARHLRAAHVKPLLRLWSSAPTKDTHLVHGLRISLHDHLRVEKIAAAVQEEIPAGDPLAGRLLDVHRMVHAPFSASVVFAHLRRAKRLPGQLERDLYQAARYVPRRQLAAVSEWAAKQRSSRFVRLHVLLAVSRAWQERGVKLPKVHREGAATLLAELAAGRAAPGLLERAVGLAGEMELHAALDDLLNIAGDPKRPVPLRRRAFESALSIDSARTLPVLRRTVKDPRANPQLRSAGIGLLGKSSAGGARRDLLELLPTAPYAVAQSIARALVATPAGAKTLLAKIEAGKASRQLLRDRYVLFGLHVAKPPMLEQRIAKLTAGLPKVDAKLQQMLAARRRGFAKSNHDAAAGAKVFKKTCSACHRVEGVGGKVGPDLDGIGLRGVDRVLEDVLDPSRNVDPAFRRSTIVTTAGRIHTGLVVEQEGPVVVLVDEKGEKVRIPKNEIDRRRISPLSAMPGNVSELVKEPDFYDLLAYLLSLRKKEAARKR